MVNSSWGWINQSSFKPLLRPGLFHDSVNIPTDFSRSLERVWHGIDTLSSDDAAKRIYASALNCFAACAREAIPSPGDPGLRFLWLAVVDLE